MTPVRILDDHTPMPASRWGRWRWAIASRILRFGWWVAK